MPLTGRRRYRVGWLGRVILQVEEGYEAMWPGSRHVTYGTTWRDARAEDLINAGGSWARWQDSEAVIPMASGKTPAHVGGCYCPSASPRDPAQAGRVPPPSSND